MPPAERMAKMKYKLRAYPDDYRKQVPKMRTISRRPIVLHLLFFMGSVFAGLGLLIAVSFLPQQPIFENIGESLQILYNTGVHPKIFDYSDASILDQCTDIAMLRASAATTSGYIGSVLTNPMYMFGHGIDLGCAECLDLFINGYAHDDVYFYTQYWMGFRVLLRPLLTVLSYFQIRRYFGFAVLLLFAWLVCDISKNLDHKVAFCFALSFILVRPQIVVNTIQYSVCFLIAFTAMVFIPWLSRHPKFETLFFMELGILTMYFDFYTVPIITLGLPLIYLYCIRAAAGDGLSKKSVALIFLSWFAGYVFMWLAKLSLTSLLTSVDGLSNGLGSFASRVGLSKNPDLLQYYSVSLAFRALMNTLASDREGGVIILLGLLALAVTGIVQFRKRGLSAESFRHNRTLLLIAGVPLIWFAVAAQPTAIHSWFQYRSVAMTYWALGVYITYVFRGGALRKA